MLNSIKELLLQSTSHTNTSGGSTGCSPAPKHYAGADILSHYQDIWEDLHKLSETNATKAERLADIINQVQTKQKSGNVALVAITQALEVCKVQSDCDGDSRLEGRTTLKCNSLIGGLQLAIDSLKRLQTVAEKVEEGLVQLENVIEEADLVKRKMEHTNQLKLYEERKMEELREYKNELASKHVISMLEQDLKEKLKLQERQDVFQDAFKSDLETYKALGTIPKIQSSSSNKPSAMLEEIQLDVDTEDLEEFLKDNESTGS